MKRWFKVMAALVVGVAVTATAFAQGSGDSQKPQHQPQTQRNQQYTQNAQGFQGQYQQPSWQPQFPQQQPFVGQQPYFQGQSTQGPYPQGPYPQQQAQPYFQPQYSQQYAQPYGQPSYGQAYGQQFTQPSWQPQFQQRPFQRQQYQQQQYQPYAWGPGYGRQPFAPPQYGAAFQQPFGLQRTMQQMGQAQPLRQFTKWSAATAQAKGRVDHEHASEGLHLLGQSLDTLVQQRNVYGGIMQQFGPAGVQQFQQQQQALSRLANILEENAVAEQHPRILRNAALSAVNVMAALQPGYNPQATQKIQQVRRAAQTIAINKPVLAQNNEVKQFFEQASDVVAAFSPQQAQGAIGGGPVQQDQLQEQDNQLRGQDKESKQKEQTGQQQQQNSKDE